MTPYDRGDIVLVPFPFSNLTATKKRPAVVISSRDFNTSTPDLIIMAVTSKIDRPSGAGECRIESWKAAGLLKASAIKPAVSTIEQTLVLRKLGSLSKQDLAAMDGAIKALLGLK